MISRNIVHVCLLSTLLFGTGEATVVYEDMTMQCGENGVQLSSVLEDSFAVISAWTNSLYMSLAMQYAALRSYIQSYWIWIKQQWLNKPIQNECVCQK